ncbi:myo-inositol-1-phosphate synthase [Candidatus Geothermarchaeota archaeon ex4572_27]|nr:MAG: myo-inositol-1-phosphate synthase [Candidatus Geothermarchaeota archaeon ex4572_27]
MIKVAILGQGMVASHLAVGIERIRLGEIEPYGVPLANIRLPYKIEDIRIVKVYDVDDDKVGKSLYEVCSRLLGDAIKVPESLKDIYVSRGIHLGSMEGMPFRVEGLEEGRGLEAAVASLVDDLKSEGVDVVVNLITTEYGEPFNDVERLKRAVASGNEASISASQAYAYVAAEYARERGPVAFVNGIPTPLANDSAFVDLYAERGSVLLGDDGATGATPLTADILEHLHERNRKVLYIAQFNIGGNTDFLALTVPQKNVMKEKTKSSIVRDILGYDAPHYIKPTGYLEPLGDKKFVSMHIGYKTFNGLEDELFVQIRINDSPAMAGNVVDTIRLAKIALDRGYKGTVYEINAFFMKKPGPPGARSIAKIVAYYNMLKWLYENRVIFGEDLPEAAREYVKSVTSA